MKMDDSKLRSLIRNCVRVHPKPAVYISGGIDSTIILHHLREKTNDKIHTYSFGVEGEENEFKDAKKIAELYFTKHQEILIKSVLGTYPEVIKYFPQPRFSLWIYWVIKKAAEDGRKTCYVGEGADEHFGGYWYKPKRSYVEQWSGLYVWGLPSYRILHNIFGLKFEAPFTYLDWRETRKFYDYEQHKRFLREAYRGILPDYVVDKKKRPANINYNLLWERELKHIYPKANPKDENEIRELLTYYVTTLWMEKVAKRI